MTYVNHDHQLSAAARRALCNASGGFTTIADVGFCIRFIRGQNGGREAHPQRSLNLRFDHNG